MPDIDERISRLLDEKIPGSSATPFTKLVSAVAHALGVLLRGSAGRFSSLATRLESMAAPVHPLRQEIADHLRDAYDHQLELGRTPEEAWERVTERFGDYESILGELETLHHVPAWEWITRMVAFPLVFIMFPTWCIAYAGMHYRNFVQLPSAMLVSIVAPLAAFGPRDWNWPGWTHWLSRSAALGAALYLYRAEGFAWPNILLVSATFALAATRFRTFASPRFVTRLRAWIVALSLGNVALGSLLFLLHQSSPAITGGAIASVQAYIVYAVLFGWPNWKVMALFSILVPASLIRVEALWSPHPFRIHQPFWTERLLTTLLISIALALAAVWAMHGRRAYACWLPAAGVLAMVGVTVSAFSNLTDPTMFMNNLVASMLPLSLWLAPVIEWIRERTESRADELQ